MPTYEVVARQVHFEFWIDVRAALWESEGAEGRRVREGHVVKFRAGDVLGGGHGQEQGGAERVAVLEQQLVLLFLQDFLCFLRCFWLLVILSLFQIVSR